MDAITILDDVVNQLTNNFKKCVSVDYLYTARRKIVEAKVYNFSNLHSWLDEMKPRCHKGNINASRESSIYTFIGCFAKIGITFLAENDDLIETIRSYELCMLKTN